MAVSRVFQGGQQTAPTFCAGNPPPQAPSRAPIITSPHGHWVQEFSLRRCRSETSAAALGTTSSRRGEAPQSSLMRDQPLG